MFKCNVLIINATTTFFKPSIHRINAMATSAKPTCPESMPQQYVQIQCAQNQNRTGCSNPMCRNNAAATFSNPMRPDSKPRQLCQTQCPHNQCHSTVFKSDVRRIVVGINVCKSDVPGMHATATFPNPKCPEEMQQHVSHAMHTITCIQTSIHIYVYARVRYTWYTSCDKIWYIAM